MQLIKANFCFRYLTVLFCGVCSCLLFTQSAYADNNKEMNVKAAILFNLARFSEWKHPQPTSFDVNVPKEQNFNICVLETDMRAALTSLVGRPIHGLKLAVVKLERLENITKNCKIVYLSESESQAADLQKLAELGVLTFGDGEKFLKHNGGISILRHGKKMDFSINRETMKIAGIQPSSRILHLSFRSVK